MNYENALNIINDITIKELSLDKIELKKEIILCGYVALLRHLSMCSYCYRIGYNANYLCFDDVETNKLIIMCQNCTPLSFKIGSNLNNAKYKRTKRLEDYIALMLECPLPYSAYFITLTFNDDTLSSTSESTRRRYVHYTLKNLSPFFIANIDYGTKNEREHYHAIILADTFPQLDKWCNKYGFTNVKKIGNSSKDCESVAKYISKLTHHAIKSSTKGSNRLIYSKQVKYLSSFVNELKIALNGVSLFGYDLINI